MSMTCCQVQGCHRAMIDFGACLHLKVAPDMKERWNKPLNISGQISIIPKPELRGFGGGFPY